MRCTCSGRIISTPCTGSEEGTKSYILNTAEIVQTIRMIEQEHLDVRTITLGLSLLDCATGDIKRTADKVYEKICREAHDLVPVGEAIEREFGIPIVN